MVLRSHIKITLLDIIIKRGDIIDSINKFVNE